MCPIFIFVFVLFLVACWRWFQSRSRRDGKRKKSQQRQYAAQIPILHWRSHQFRNTSHLRLIANLITSKIRSKKYFDLLLFVVKPLVAIRDWSCFNKHTHRSTSDLSHSHFTTSHRQPSPSTSTKPRKDTRRRNGKKTKGRTRIIVKQLKYLKRINKQQLVFHSNLCHTSTVNDVDDDYDDDDDNDDNDGRKTNANREQKKTWFNLHFTENKIDRIFKVCHKIEVEKVARPS